jgi:hypothetical protein
LLALVAMDIWGSSFNTPIRRPMEQTDQCVERTLEISDDNDMLREHWRLVSHWLTIMT